MTDDVLPAELAPEPEQDAERDWLVIDTGDEIEIRQCAAEDAGGLIIGAHRTRKAALAQIKADA